MDGEYPEFYEQLEPTSKSNKKIWLWILIPILITIIGAVAFYFIFLTPQTISSNELSNGINIQIKESQEAKFILDNHQQHTLRMGSVHSNSVNLIIQSTPRMVSIKVGEIKRFDLDNDGFYDLYIKLKRIEEGIPEIYIREIHERMCIEQWGCEEWGVCSEEGIQTRTCNDENSCGTTNNKPSTTQNCNYTCIEDWDCTDWSECVNGYQTRECMDSNSCGTNESKPNEQQDCTISVIDCGSNSQSQETSGNPQPNFDCFIDASENCEPSKLLNKITLEIFGMITSYSTHMELKGMENGECIYYQRTESSSVKFSDELVQSMLDGGATQEEINQQEQTANETAHSSVGIENTCEFDNEELTSMLERWKEGNSHGGATCIINPDETYDCTYTGDFENATCISGSP